ncbi:aldehyde dehydrogenase [Aeromicrobium ginsengisoli]|uniref:Aldehyde dehydrogenase n=1 Tax=Aeromicrobium ginsengisoli TaxID=363867 RepID=A0A5M4FAL4_9ACTN|nr:aldehyde dehydrogenase [Aeromicrobium ginsengisoli]KAA1394251.1 aldehyde dehydrogenase [Aeromicrobium ginsengisoli]
MPHDLERPDLYIDGAWVAPRKGESFEQHEASTGQRLGSAAMAGTDDVDDAVAAARRALTGEWGRLTAAERSAAILRFADELKKRGRDTSALVSRENGMPIALSGMVNGFGPAVITRYYGELAAGLDAEDIRPSPTGGDTVVLHRPVGVIGAVTPWNYPQPLAIMKIAPALAAGCTVVLKPPPETGLDGYVIADAVHAAGLPAGVVNVLAGGREVGAHLVGHPGVDKVAFTGSTLAGRTIGETAGRLLRPVTLELGGKSVSLVLDDADLGLFASKILEVSLPNNGQTCHAATRILAPRSRYAEVVDLVTDVVGGAVVGDPLDPATQIGPVVTAAQRDRVLSYVELGRQTARLTTGGSAAGEAGWFVEPAVFADVDNSSPIAQEEIFGPVLVVTPYDDVDDAVAIANDSDFGLGGVVWSADAERGFDVAARIETGSVGVNHYELHINAPFGGVKSSGLGRELGPEGVEPYLRTQSIYRR